MSIVRKSQIVGATIGALLTIAIQMLVETYGYGDDLVGYFLGLLWELILLPVRIASSIFGKQWQLGGPYVPRTFLCLMVVTNSTLCVLLGTVIGWCLGSQRRSKRQ